jgi:hypothetical protein
MDKTTKGHKMKFATLGTGADASGTSLVGYIETTRQRIEEVFGAPSYSSNDNFEKVTVEWVIKFEDGSVATIYDWKRYELGTPSLSEMYEWHIGGHNKKTALLVSEALSSQAYDFDMSSPNFRKKI